MHYSCPSLSRFTCPLPLPYRPKTPQICEGCFEPSRGRVIWALQWDLLALISPSSRRHFLSSHLQSGDTSAVDTSLAEGTRRKMERLTEAFHPSRRILLHVRDGEQGRSLLSLLHDEQSRANRLAPLATSILCAA